MELGHFHSFMMINSRRAAGKDRVILWFNVSCSALEAIHKTDIGSQGGPGCSSFDGSLMEVGPFRTIPAAQTESGQVELQLVEGGWEEFATIVFGKFASKISNTLDLISASLGTGQWISLQARDSRQYRRMVICMNCHR